MAIAPVQALEFCATKEACLKRLSSGECCCPSGSTGTQQTCPDGWSYDIFNKVCTRSSTSGSDSIGYYTQSYGTCAGTPQTYDCYTKSTSGDPKCACNI